MAGPDALLGVTISHYRILEKLGGGGMGVVRKHPPLYLDLKYYREDADKWFADTSIVGQLMEGLRKLGLKDFRDSSV